MEGLTPATSDIKLTAFHKQNITAAVRCDVMVWAALLLQENMNSALRNPEGGCSNTILCPETQEHSGYAERPASPTLNDSNK